MSPPEIIPKLTTSQITALRLHNIKILTFKDTTSTILSKNDNYLAQWDYTHQQWDVQWDDDLDKNIELLNSILGPDSAY